MKTLAILAETILLIAMLLSPASAQVLSERLVYDVTWSGIKAGTAVLEVTAQGDGSRIINTIHSEGLVSTFFRVDDRTESVVSRDGRPKFFSVNNKEGKHRARREVTFDFASLHADSRDLQNNTRKRDHISARTYDNVSSIYFIRSIELTPGQVVLFDIYDAKRLWKAEMRVVKRQEVATAVGTFKTLMVTSSLTHNGVAAPVGNTTFWFTDDSRRIPVKITTKLRVGDMTLTLSAASP